MGIASRHAGAPYVNGEVLSGTDLETDIANVYAQVNGGLSSVNIAASAGILGSQLANQTVTNTQVLDSTLTIAKMAASAVSNFKVIYTDTSTASTATAVETWRDVEGITQQTITPGQANDLILIYFQGVISRVWGQNVRWDFQLRFSQNGSATPAMSKMTQLDSTATISQTTELNTVTAMWAYQALSTTALAIKPQYSQVITAGVALTWGLRFMLAAVIPAKV